MCRPFVLGALYQSDRDAEVIAADEACNKAAIELELGRKARVRAASEKQRDAFARKRSARADAWAEQLTVQVSMECITAHAQLRPAVDKR